jgi:ribosomal protein S18 acetylase RimI-like enzyme
MSTPNYIVRNMTRTELDLAVEWAAAEGWNPGLHDADSFYAADPNGFLIGLLDDEPIAVISVVKYGADFGFLGFYIVKPEYRGQGYGLKIWNAGMESLQGRNVGLDGVVAQQENYKRSGFQLAYNNRRYEGSGGGEVDSDAQLVPLSYLAFDTVAAYDQPFFPADRTTFLRHWLTLPESTVLGWMQDDQLAGYGMVRLCRNGYKIGPLFADTPDIAQKLFLALKACVPQGAALFLDTPETNPAAVELAQNAGMTMVFETARMYTGALPNLPIERLYGVTTFELG